VIASPLSSSSALDVYLNYGHGLSLERRARRVRHAAVTPLTRAIATSSARGRGCSTAGTSARRWRLDLANETVWTATTEHRGDDPTIRYGVELETRFELTRWLAADLDLIFSHSQFSTDRSNGGGSRSLQGDVGGGVSARHPLGRASCAAACASTERRSPRDRRRRAHRSGVHQLDLHLGYRHRWLTSHSTSRTC